jgi:Asp-tRNA(Asn)/Glu-tRNA(Gln) amidotransferase A subunit family amidase
VRPAAFCGVAGYVPTHGRVSAEGSLRVSRTLDRLGLLAADVEGLELAAPTLVASWHPVRWTREPVLGVAGGPFLDAVEPAARELFERQLDALAAAGYQVCRATLFEDAEEVAESLRRIMNGELAREHAALFERYRDRYRAQTAAGIEHGMGVTDEQLAVERRALVERRSELESRRRAVGVDLWITPAALGPAPLGIEASGSPWPHLPWSYLGLPAVAVPAGTLGALPVGLQLVAGWHADEELLQWAGRLATEVELASGPAAPAAAQADEPSRQAFSWY